MSLQFLKKYGSFIVALQNTGIAHICHPASSRVIKPSFFRTVKNAFATLNSPIDDIYLAISEIGTVESFQIKPTYEEAGFKFKIL